MPFNPISWQIHKHANLGLLLDKALEDGSVLVEVGSEVTSRRLIMDIGKYCKAYKAQLERNPDTAYDATRYEFISTKVIKGKGDYAGNIYVFIMNDNQPEFKVVDNPGHVLAESGFTS